ncbi:MAG TPA: DUF4390 domain-containing protein [Myxococcota bacterium]|jgi:hypothetical protein|nr:DUF4390 domain-containing protein [Myxococcota bacterium]
MPRAPTLAALAAAAAAAAAAALAAPPHSVARAEGEARVPVRTLSIYADRTFLYASAAFADLFDARLTGKLADGFTTTLAMRVLLFEAGRDEPVSLAVRTVKIRYDLWEEVFLVKASDARGVTSLKLARREDAVAAATALDFFPVAPLALADPARVYFVAFRVEVDPTSKEMLEEYTRWITRPPGARPPGASKSFFGSFVSLFVYPPKDAAAKVLLFRSIDFRVPK